MIQQNHFSHIYDFLDATECFSNVEIKGGINYFLWQLNYQGKCKYVLHQGNNIVERYDYLDPLGTGVIIRDAMALNIISKVSVIEGDYFVNKSFVSVVSPKHYFDRDITLSSNWKGYSKTKDKKHNIKYYLNKKLEPTGIGWIESSDIPKGHETIPLHKVFIPKAGGSGTDPYVLGTPIYGEPNSVCSYTYLVLGYDSKNHNFTYTECMNLISYIKTRFFRYMVSIKKKTQDNPRDVFQFVPLQNLNSKSDIDWSKSVDEINRQLYAKYHLTEKEISFIESMIKPM